MSLTVKERTAYRRGWRHCLTTGALMIIAGIAAVTALEHYLAG